MSAKQRTAISREDLRVGVRLSGARRYHPPAAAVSGGTTTTPGLLTRCEREGIACSPGLPQALVDPAGHGTAVI
jgi:hypothetical protein